MNIFKEKKLSNRRGIISKNLGSFFSGPTHHQA
jgi:hypothetical protein